MKRKNRLGNGCRFFQLSASFLIYKGLWNVHVVRDVFPDSSSREVNSGLDVPTH
jgi:hypothetical protein